MQKEKILHNSNQQENSSKSTGELESDDEMCAYEKLRAKNIAERQKKFEEFKLANLASEVSTAYKKSKKKTPHPKKSTTKKEILPRRIIPSRNCRPKNFPDESQDNTEEDQSVHEDLNNVSKSEENPPEIPRYVLTKIE